MAVAWLGTHFNSYSLKKIEKSGYHHVAKTGDVGGSYMTGAVTLSAGTEVPGQCGSPEGKLQEHMPDFHCPAIASLWLNSFRTWRTRELFSVG